MTNQVIGNERSVVHKFGKNPNIDTATVPQDVWDGVVAYPFPAAAAAGTIVSGSADDAAEGTGARTVQIYGLVAGFLRQTEVITLDGTTPVDLANNYLRIFRAKVLTAGSGETNAGALTIAVGGTTVAQILAGEGQTLMAIFTTAAGESMRLVSWFASIVGKTAGKAEVVLQMRTDGGAWQTKMVVQITDAFGLNYTFPVPFIVPPKTDIRVRVTDVAANDTEVSATFGLVQV